MELSAKDLSAITGWAERNEYVSEVRLFGSRAKGTSRPDSDIDLAITVVSADRGNTGPGIYMRFGDEWQRELAGLVGRHVSLKMYEPSAFEANRIETIIIWTRST